MSAIRLSSGSERAFMRRETAGLGNARARLFAMLRAYIRHGVENPALYRLMFGGYLNGRIAIERAASEKIKALLRGASRQVIAPIPPRNDGGRANCAASAPARS
jgi:hypothetical protein